MGLYDMVEFSQDMAGHESIDSTYPFKKIRAVADPVTGEVSLARIEPTEIPIGPAEDALKGELKRQQALISAAHDDIIRDLLVEAELRDPSIRKRYLEAVGASTSNLLALADTEGNCGIFLGAVADQSTPIEHLHELAALLPGDDSWVIVGRRAVRDEIDRRINKIPIERTIPKGSIIQPTGAIRIAQEIRKNLGSNREHKLRQYSHALAWETLLAKRKANRSIADVVDFVRTHYTSYIDIETIFVLSGECELYAGSPELRDLIDNAATIINNGEAGDKSTREALTGVVNWYFIEALAEPRGIEFFEASQNKPAVRQLPVTERRRIIGKLGN